MTRRSRRIWLGIVTALYLAGAIVIGFWPTPVDRGIDGQIDGVLAFLHRGGLPLAFDYQALEFTANVCFFIPVGLLLCLELRPRLWFLAVLAGVLLSGGIELSQLLLLPARYASWNDIAANTIGTCIGVLLVLIARGVRHARVRRRYSSGPNSLR